MHPEQPAASPWTTYRCPRADKTPVIRGRIEEAVWTRAPHTTRFVDAATGGVAFLHTQARLAWDDHGLYIAGELEERDIWTTGEPRDGLVWNENTFEVFLASDGALYNLSVNAAGDTQELLFIWKDACVDGGRYDVDDLDIARRRPSVVGGDAGPRHPRGLRWMFDDWTLPGLVAAVRVEGDLNERLDIDRGWTVELALPWSGLTHLLDGANPPPAGQHLRLALGRNQIIDQRVTRITTTWSWHIAGQDGMLAPERYPVLELAAG